VGAVQPDQPGQAVLAAADRQRPQVYPVRDRQGGDDGGQIGRSVSWLSQVERGTRAVDRMSVLIDLSRVLKVDIAELTGQPFALAPNGGLEPEGLADIRRVLMRYTQLPDAINPGRSTTAPAPDLTQLRSRVDTAWQLRQASRYGQLGPRIAGLVADAEQATQRYRGDEQRTAFTLLAETYQVARAMLRKLGDTHLAWIAADRAVQAGRQAENPLLVAVGARALSQVFTESGRLDAALDISLSSAAALEPRLRSDRSGPEGWSVWGALMLTAALAASRDNDIGATWDYLRRAERAAEHLGADRNNLWTSFGPTNVAIHGVSVTVELGDVAETIECAERINTTALPADLLERRSNVFIDLGRAYVQRRDDAAATAVFRQAEQLAPEEVHYSVPVREALREMLKREHRYATPELRPLARRTGVIS
jgi:transcriptional regulator with XRE-family HTH domain